MERMTGIEPVPSAWKAEVLPLNHIRISWSGRRDSNSRPSPWQGDALPLSHFRISYSFFKIGRGRWIRTIESSANGFTVRPLWPLGNPSTYACLFRRLLCHLQSLRCSSTSVHSAPRLPRFRAFCEKLRILLLELVEGIEPPTC